MQLWQGFLLVGALSGFGAMAYRLHQITVFSQIDAELSRRVAAIVSDLRPRGPFREPSGRPPFEDGRDLPPPHHGGGGPGGPMDLGPGSGFGGDRGPRGRGGRFEDPFEGRAVRLSAETLALFDPEDAEGGSFAVWSRSGSLMAATNAPAGLTCPVRQGTLTGIHARSVGARREAFQFTGPGECVLAGRSIERDLAGLRRFAWFLAAAGAAVLGVGLGGGWFLAGRALRPVEEISAAASRISAGRLSERIDVTETESELGRLAAVLNSTFARLESSFAQQQQFTADASHELRTPIAVIIAEAQMALARERAAGEYRGSLETCLDAAQQMRRLAGSLLELARYDGGQESIDRQPLDLAELVRSCVDLITPLARERGLSVSAELSTARVSGDADRLMQVVTNLLTNAIAYNRPGGTIRVATRPMAGAAVVEVADSGIGISAEDLPHVFERFYRVEKARSRSEGHHGLGLAITRAVVEAHGGTIEVASTAGVGSTFTVRLPAAIP